MGLKIIAVLCMLIHLIAPSASADEYDNAKLLTLIKACADIGDFDSVDYDENDLMRRFLYTYRNFEILSDIPSYAVTSDKVTMCSSAFVNDAVYKAFRINPPSPAPSMLTELGYCENNGFYSFYGGYTDYFATDVLDILKIVTLHDGSLYVIFNNEYRHGDNIKTEYSSMIIGCDNDGYYVKAINMDDDFARLRELINPPSESTDISVRKHLPVIVIGFTILSVCVASYIFFFRK